MKENSNTPKKHTDLHKSKKVTPENESFNSRLSHGKNSIPGINTPGIELPAFNPPVPNRAWTAMKNGLDIEALSPEEKADLYLGSDNIL